MGHKWLITSSLAWSGLSLAHAAGRTRAATDAQSCSKAIVLFFFFSCFVFSAGSQQTAPLLNAPPPLLKPKACHSPYPHQPPAFPSCTQACLRKSKAAIRTIDTWNALILTNLSWSVCLTWWSTSTTTRSISTEATGSTCTKDHLL